MTLKPISFAKTMTTQFVDFKESMIAELTNFIQSQAGSLSLGDLDQLVIDSPALRERFVKIPLQTYPYLPDQLEFLCLFVEEQVVGRNRDLAEEPVAEAAFALLYFQRAADLVPDTIPGLGLLDDAMVVSLVLRRNEQVFKRSTYGYKVHWPEAEFDVDELLSVISPLRVTSFCRALSRPPA